MVWVRFPGLGLEFWSEKILFNIYQEIGTSIKIDNATANCEVGYYANVLVEIDFAQYIPSKVWIGTKYGGFFQDVLIPDCPKFCSHCKIVGHLNSECNFEKQRRFDTQNVNQVQTPNVNQPVSVSNTGETNGVQQVKFSPLKNVENGCIPEAIIQEVPKVVEVVQNEDVNIIKFVDGTNGTIVNVPVQITSWANVLEKKMVTSNASASTAASPANQSKPQVISVSSQMITVSVGDVLVSGVHAHVNLVQRRFLWSEMKLISDLNKPWIILGDFNAILSQDEKIGDKSPNRNSILEVSDCLNQCELIQAPKNGLNYTWSNRQQGSKRILCTLDRVVFNQKWIQLYGDWGYKVGMRIVSDHAPLLGGCASIPKPQNVPRIFQKMWLSHPNFLNVVADCWANSVVGDPAFRFLQKLKNLNKVLNDWNWQVFGNVHVKIKEDEDRVKLDTQISYSNPFDEEALQELVKAQNDHASREAQENTLLRKKSRVKWIKEG
ncbi:uncharacterized protein LOC113273290 [Papaver somniferum]|uniref:uncharacterized protein LOC113273290 n=1 Tax=Papaver somniferum TaxID=3469 RepID=UPI000E6FD2FE|nr:uncharacterized protein LOC113273290 [Papaver somniferum]